MPIYEALAQAFAAEGVAAHFTLMGDGNMRSSGAPTSPPLPKGSGCAARPSPTSTSSSRCSRPTRRRARPSCGTSTSRIGSSARARAAAWDAVTARCKAAGSLAATALHMFGRCTHHRRFALQVKKNALNRGFRSPSTQSSALFVARPDMGAPKATTRYSNTLELQPHQRLRENVGLNLRRSAHDGEGA